MRQDGSSRAVNRADVDVHHPMERLIVEFDRATSWRYGQPQNYERLAPGHFYLDSISLSSWHAATENSVIH